MISLNMPFLSDMGNIGKSKKAISNYQKGLLTCIETVYNEVFATGTYLVVRRIRLIKNLTDLKTGKFSVVCRQNGFIYV